MSGTHMKETKEKVLYSPDGEKYIHFMALHEWSNGKEDETVKVFINTYDDFDEIMIDFHGDWMSAVAFLASLSSVDVAVF